MTDINFGKVADQKERDRIIEALDRNLLVEASAGSGKTSSLVQRMIALIKSGTYHVEEIAAITFTKKAAIELKERFQQEIEKIFSETKNTDERKFLRNALNDIEQCYVGTIHAFCARILRERPIEAGLDPEFGELDEIDNTLLKDEAWESYLKQSKIEESPALLHLDTIGIKPFDLKDLYKTVCNYPDAKPQFKKSPKPDLGKPFRELLSFCRDVEVHIPDEEPVNGYDGLQKAILQVKRIRGFKDFIRKDFNKVKLLEGFEGKLKIVLKKWKNKEKAKLYRDSLFLNFQEEVILPVLQQWREYCYAGTIESIFPAVKYYHDLREKISMLNYEDLLLKTSSLLKDNSEVRQYFQRKYRCLLVDEFQDTDPVQAEIIFYLTGQDIRGKNWKKLLPRPGSLFVVGDPQQSIYRFRRADIAIYNLVKDLIRKSGGEIINLYVNFRSLHSIGSYLNPVFEELFLPGKGKFQANYASMHTFKEDHTGMPTGVRRLVIQKDRIKNNTQKADARAIAGIIRQLTDHSLPFALNYKDFMIILRNKRGMEIYAQTLADSDIPFTVSGFSSLNESNQVKECLKLFRLLTDIENQILLVAVLRGIFFGFSDDELYRFREAGGEFNLYTETIPDKLTTRLKDEFRKVFSRLCKYHRWTQDLPPVIAMEKIMIDSGLLPHSCFQGYHLKKCAELYFILEKMRKNETENSMMFGSLVEKMEKILNAGIEDELDILHDENAVRIMNLHKAKGLESPVVFLAISNNATKHTPLAYIEREGSEPESHFLVCRSNPYHNGKGKVLAQPENWEAFCSTEKAYTEAENIRLLYVAATRARNLLVISTPDKGNEKNNTWQPLLENINEEIKMSVAEKELPEKRTLESMAQENALNDEYKKIQTGIRQWVTEASRKNYLDKKPTDFKDEEKRLMIKTVDVGGIQWGTAVHKMLDILIKEEPEGEMLSLKIEKILENLEISIERKSTLEKVIQDFKLSELYLRLKHAEFKYTEVPFSIRILPENPLYRDLNTDNSIVPILLSGTIDLVFKEKDGWVIVDYKTDHPLYNDDYAGLSKVYQKQIDIYCHVWKEITGEKVKESFIYFIK